MTNYEDVQDLYKKFNLPIEYPPRILPPDLADFRIRFLEEELYEYVDATVLQNQEKLFDALLDLVYVAIGTAIFHGFPWEEGWNEVHRANMEKYRPDDPSLTKRDHEYDLLKPIGWKSPDIKGVLAKAQEKFDERQSMLGSPQLSDRTET